jgi:hypothetical protein
MVIGKLETHKVMEIEKMMVKMVEVTHQRRIINHLFLNFYNRK